MSELTYREKFKAHYIATQTAYQKNDIPTCYNEYTKAMEILKECQNNSNDFADVKWAKNQYNTLLQGYIVAQKNYQEYLNKKNVRSSSSPESKKITSGDKEIQDIIDGVDVKKLIEFSTDGLVSFKDVIGMEEAKEIFKMEYNPTEKEKILKEKFGIDDLHFVLLYGVPGTGKTFFAKAVANEMGIPFVFAPCGKLKGSLVGSTEHNIQALFKYCAQYDKCILFMDEFEEIARSRNTSNVHETTQAAVTNLLQAIDGFASNKNVLLIAATNYPSSLDSAILSRVDKNIEVPLPAESIILEALKRKLSKCVSRDVSLEKLAKALYMKKASNRDVSKFCDNLKRYAVKIIDEDENADLSSMVITADMVNKFYSSYHIVTHEHDIEEVEKFKKGLE